MKSTIFREYDIRGIIGEELEIKETYELAKAIATYLKQKHNDLTKIVIGRDARLHSEPINTNVINAFLDMGFDVIDAGIVPTPTVYFAIKHFNLQTGIVITASHNPKEYNGIKMWGVAGQQIQEIRKILESKNFYNNTSDKKGSLSKSNIVDTYIDYLAEHFKHLKDSGINAIIDCGNATGGIILPKLLKQLNLKNVRLLFEEVDGNFPNHEADPTVPENMTFVKKELMENTKLEVGLGLDGDCDRMNPMTKTGELVPGDKLLAVFAKKLLQDFPKAAVVFDIKSSGGLIEVLKSWNAQPCISPSGHSLIKRAMAKNNALLAGELSCHFFFHDRYFGYDDGIYATMRLFEILIESKQSLEELLSVMPKKISSPEFRIKCKTDAEKSKIVDSVKSLFATKKDAELLLIDGIRAQMPYGWGLARASNTQPVICLRFESDTKDGLTRVKNDFFEALKPFFDEKDLRVKIEL